MVETLKYIKAEKWGKFLKQCSNVQASMTVHILKTFRDQRRDITRSSSSLEIKGMTWLGLDPLAMLTGLAPFNMQPVLRLNYTEVTWSVHVVCKNDQYCHYHLLVLPVLSVHKTVKFPESDATRWPVIHVVHKAVGGQSQVSKMAVSGLFANFIGRLPGNITGIYH